MTEQQLIAIKNFTLIAEECANPKFASQYGRESVVLTVNAGYE